jgi:hypothetical protein
VAARQRTAPSGLSEAVEGAARVRTGVDVLDSDLEAVEGARLVAGRRAVSRSARSFETSLRVPGCRAVRLLATHLRHLQLLHEPHRQVLKHDAVGRGEEGQHVADEVLLVHRQLVPVLLVVAQVHLLSCEPRGGGQLCARGVATPGSARKAVTAAVARPAAV